MNNLQFHPLADIFPLLPETELASLAQDIKTNGLQQPIWLYDEKIIDGRNRYLACLKAGVPPLNRDYKGNDPLGFVVSMNLHRRHLNESQRAMVAGKLANLQLGDNQHKRGSPNLDTLSLEKAAKMLNVSRANVANAKAIMREAPEQVQAIEQGSKSVNQVLKEIKKAEVSKTVGDMPKDKYRVIYADPPWSYNDKCDGGSVQAGGCERHYPTMSVPALCAMAIPAQDDAVLFLWATSPLLEDALTVIRAWGFQYKASFVWDKVKHNMGHYNSVRHEFLLICTKGSCTPDVLKLFDSVQVIERTPKHSQKPEEFREIIDTLYPHGNRIELFRRGDAPKGWAVWGNEAAV